MSNIDDHKKGSIWSNLPETLKALAAIITAIGSLAGLLIALNQIGALDKFKPAPAPTPTQVAKYGWAVYFEYEFGANFWKPGMNSYQIVIDCPDTAYFGDINGQVDFSVDANAQLFPDNVVELRSFGILSPNAGEPNLSSIHPGQKTKILAGYMNISQEQANQAINECQTQAIINNDITAIQLSPVGPVPEK